MLLRPLQRLKKSESVGAQGQEVTFESSLETQLGLQRGGAGRHPGESEELVLRRGMWKGLGKVSR